MNKASGISQSERIRGDDKRLQKGLHAPIEVSKTLTSLLDLPDLLNAIINKIIGVVEPAEIGAVMLWDQATATFRPWAVFGYDLKILSEIELQKGESVTGKTFDKNEAHLFKTPKEVEGIQME